jgi:hypothetical protein
LSRHAVARPALEGGRERLLKRVLGEVEVAEDADQGCEDSPALFAEEPVGLSRRGQLAGAPSRSKTTTGRTSIFPMRADGIFAAHSSALSSDSASIR